jgi:hypothetical protein
MRKYLSIFLIILIICLLYLLYNRNISINEHFESDNWDQDTELIIVSSHYGEDLEWLKNAPVPVVVCGKEGEKPGAIESHPKCKTVNQGNEASSYLKFIIEFYDKLPKYILFIHGHENSPHQKINLFDAIREQKWLNKDYYSVNKNGLANGVVGPHNEVVICNQLVPLWDIYFRPYLKRDAPSKVKVDCCAQFIISKEAILRHPKEAYEHWFKFLSEDYKKHPDIIKNSRDVAIIFEYIWHIIFGQPDEIKEL